jgi:hypothetical protein
MVEVMGDETEVIEDQMPESIPLDEDGMVVLTNRPFETVFDIDSDVDVGSGDFDPDY